MLYTSTENSHVKELKKLNTKKFRDEKGLFLIEGEHLVKEAYKRGYIQELILLENTKLSLDVITSYVSTNVLKYISELETPQPIMAVTSKIVDKEIGEKVLILDGIQDPGNLGTIIRSAVAFDVDTIIMSKDCVDLYNPKVIRATQGLIFSMNIIVCNLEEKIKELKQKDYAIYGTSVVNGNLLKTIEKKKLFAIIVGNEGNGVRDNINALCDNFIYINMNDACESLNVAVATSIILYEFNR